MSGGTHSLNIGQTASATFAADGRLVAKVDAGSTIVVGDLDTKNGAELYNTYDDLMIQTNEIFQGERYIDALGIGSVVSAASANADDLVVGGTAASNSGVTILDSTACRILFGDAGSNAVGGFTYLHSSDNLAVTVGGAVQWRFTGSALHPETDNAETIGTASLRPSALHVMEATVYGGITMSDAAAVITIGTGGGTPGVVRDKSDAGQFLDRWRVGGVNRWITTFETDEDLGWYRYNSSGVFQDVPVLMDQSSGDVTLAQNLIPSSGSDLGDATAGWNHIYHDDGSGTPKRETWDQGAPDDTKGGATDGNVYWRTDGSAGTFLYARLAGSWAALA